MAMNVTMGTKMSYRMSEEAKLLGTMIVCTERSLFLWAKIGMFDGVLVLSVLHRCEAWALGKNIKR